MFGLSLRERTEEALRRGARAALTGAFFHHTEAEKFNLNKEASSYLYTEALAHQIYMLGIIFGQTCVGKEKWATPDFFFKSVAKGITEHEKEDSLQIGSISSFVFKRFMEMEELSPEKRRNGEHFKQSVTLVKNRDSSADENEITNALENASEKYYHQAKKMF